MVRLPPACLELGNLYSNNVLDATTMELLVTDEAELAGMPKARWPPQKRRLKPKSRKVIC